MKKVLIMLLCLALTLTVFSGAALAEEDSLFTDRDLSQEADLSGAETIALMDSSVTIDHAGVFVLSGSIENGQVLVEAGEEDKVQLVLDGVTIHAETGAAIEVKTADKVFITLAQGSENSLSSEKIDEDGADGVIYSKADLTLNGLGSLTVTADTGKGIVCKDTLAITGGIYSIQASGHGITGKDALNIADGSFTITTGGGSQAVEMKVSDDFGTRGAFPGGFNGRNMSAGMTPPDGFGRQDAPMANTSTQAASQDEETE
ncbi:MAG: carbohydrate-binding domain-containing protein, partial [Faecousia sp.]